MSIFTPLVMNNFREIKENIATNTTDMEFHSFDHTIGFLSFWQVVRYKDFVNEIRVMLISK